MIIQRFVVTLLIFLVVGTAFAEDGESTSWSIVERCLPAPIMPDDHWLLDGEILLSGWAGIHGVSKRLDTPYVVHWGNGALSPDGQWILTQKERVEVEQLTGGGPMGRYDYFYGDILAENLNTGEQRTFPWDADYSMTSRPYLAPPAGPLWLDNHRFAAGYGYSSYETRIGDLETGEIVDWAEVSLEDYEISISPDLTRMISYSQIYDLSDNHLIKEETVGTGYDFVSSVWAHDSSMFIDIQESDNRETMDMAIYDRDGNVLAVPFVGKTWNSEITRIWLGQWSPTDDYFAFGASGGYRQDSYQSRTFILDLRNQIIIDLCMGGTSGWAWSPDGLNFAALFGDGQQPIVVTNMSEWQPRIVGYHTGRVIFWRSLA